TPRPAVWWIVPVTLLVGGVVGGLAWLLLAAGWSAAEATARQGAIQTAPAAGAGVGAAVTLMPAFRRQRHQEHAAHVTAHLAERNAQLTEQIAERNAALAEQVADNTKHDATERRVTDLYTKAAEQLGHAGAAVRLAGLYALERLAQDNPGHRQTIVNVICAYLRMPYTPPPRPDTAADRAEALRAARRRHHALRTAARGRTTPPPTPAGADTGPDTEGERQVRLTDQRILTDHLRDQRTLEQRESQPADARFWPGMHVDLAGAALIDLDFLSCRLTRVDFHRATFTGVTWFDGATFTGNAMFGGTTFHQEAWFDQATFVGNAMFDEAIVRRPEADHSWPMGWAVVACPDGRGRLERVAKTTADPSLPDGSTPA
ncbi:pentapeptide repeat-containing protein, partial [Streptosporangium sp. NPDC003464]